MPLLASNQLLNKVLCWWHRSINRVLFKHLSLIEQRLFYIFFTVICYFDYIGNLIKASVSHTESLTFLNLRSILEWRTFEFFKGKKKKKKTLSFLPRQQRPFSHCYLVSLFWVVSPDRELVSYNSIVTLSNSPSSLLLFKVVQNSTEHCRHLDSALKAGSWNKTMPTDFKAISFPLWKFLLLILNRFTEWSLTSC